MWPSNPRIHKWFTSPSTILGWSTAIRFHCGRDSTRGGVLPGRSFLSGWGLIFSRSLDSAGVGRSGAIIGATAEAFGITGDVMRSIATPFMIATHTFTVISGAMRLLAAVIATCAGLPGGDLLHQEDSGAAPRPPCAPDGSGPLAELPAEATRGVFLREAFPALEADFTAEDFMAGAAVVSFRGLTGERPVSPTR